MSISSATNEKEISENRFFVQLLTEHPVLLEKSQTPANKVKKELALEVIINALCNKTGKKYAAKTLSKKIANLKSRLKMKIEINFNHPSLNHFMDERPKKRNMFKFSRRDREN